MFTSLRCASGRAAVGRISGWPAALAASLLIHTGLALFTAPLGLARQVLLDRPLHVDWRRLPAPVGAPTVAPRAPSPPVNPPQPARPALRRDRPAAPVAVVAAEAPSATLQALAPSSASTSGTPSPRTASASATPASATPASTTPAIIAPASVADAPLTEAPVAVVADHPPATPAAAPLADLAAYCRQRPAPIYPAVARRRGEHGRVLVSVDIDARGLVARAEVATSSGSRWLDSAALAAVRGWRCTAAQQAGQAVVGSVMQAFSFVLRDAQR